MGGGGKRKRRALPFFIYLITMYFDYTVFLPMLLGSKRTPKEEERIYEEPGIKPTLQSFSRCWLSCPSSAFKELTVCFGER